MLAAVGVGGYFGFDALTEGGDGDDAAQTQLVPVTRGNLRQRRFRNRHSHLHHSRDRCHLASRGPSRKSAWRKAIEVSEGDPLARLDDETAANLEKAVAQARVDLRNAEEALEEARSPYTAAQIAKAESDVANARLDLQDAEEELNELGVASPDLLVQARIDILNATADLEAANESRTTLVTPTFQTMAKAQSDVTAARLALQEAEDDLDVLLNPADADVAAAEADVAKARLELDAARDALDALTNVDPLDLAKAQAAVADRRT